MLRRKLIPKTKAPAKKAAKKEAAKKGAKAPVKKAAKKVARKLPARKAAPGRAPASLWNSLDKRPLEGPVTSPLAADLGSYPAFIDYRNRINDHFGQVNLFEMGAMRDTPTDVAMADLFVRPALLTTHINPAEATPEKLAAGLDLLAVLREERHLIVLGDPGAGKSTLVNWLAYALANPRLKAVQQALGSLLPLPIVLRDVFHNAAPGKSTEPTAAALVGLFLTQHFAAPLLLGGGGHELLEVALAEGRAFLLLDGIDELPDAQRHWLRDAYHDFTTRYPGGRSLLTSRVIGYESCPFHKVLRYQESKTGGALPSAETALPLDRDALQTLADVEPPAPASRKGSKSKITRITSVRASLYYTAPFDDERLREFATRWYRLRSHSASKSMDTAEDFLRALEKSPSTHDLRRSPILLTYMAIVFRAGGHLPDGRSDLYGKIAEAFLETIPTRRKLEIPCHRQDAGVWLAHVAFQLQLRRAGQKDKLQSLQESRSAILISEGELLALLTEAMEEHPPSPADPASGRKNDLTPRRLLDYLSQRAGLLLPRGRQDGGEAYAFTHLSFQEYFAAQYLNSRFTNYKELHDAGHLPPEIALPALRGYVRDSRWAETFLLLFEILTLTPGPAIHPATLAGYLYAPENEKAPVLNWFLHATFGKKNVSLSIGAESPPALVLLCNLINDAYIQLAPLDEAPRHLLLHALADAVARSDQGPDNRALHNGNAAVQAFLNLKARTGDPAPLTLLFEAVSKCGTNTLNLGGTPVINVTTLQQLTKLDSLSLSDTQVSDVTALQSLVGLRTLHLHGSKVRDVTALQRLTGLQTLYLHGTQVSDVAALQGLTALETLSLSSTQVSELKPLQRLTGLKSLFLYDTPVTDVTALQSLTALKTLYLSRTRVSDVTALHNLTGLTTLYLDGTRVSDVTVLQRLTSLQILDLNGTPVCDIAPLQNLTALWALFLDRTQVSDLTALQGLTLLRRLNLRNTPVSDTTALQSLTKLQELDLSGAPVSDVTALGPMNGSLTQLWLQETPVSQDKAAMAALRKALPNTEIHA